MRSLYGNLSAGTEVCLDGSGSTDEADPGEPAEICRYEWLLVQRPPGSSAQVDPASSERRGGVPDAPITCLTTDVPGGYVVALLVTECGDAGLRSAPARYEFLANPPGG